MSEDSSNEAVSLVTLGRITAHYGLNGWVKVHSDTVPRENIAVFKEWRLVGRRANRTVDVLEGRVQGKTIVARLAGVDTREQAEELIGSDIAVLRSDLPLTDDDEVYWTDLIGLDVVNTDGAVYGTVDRLFDTGANDVVVVKDGRDGSKRDVEILIPWIRPDVIVEVDKQGGRIVVDWDPDY